MLTNLLFKRLDGTFVGTVNGLPYHIVDGDIYWAEAQQIAADMGDELTFEPTPPAAPWVAGGPM